MGAAGDLRPHQRRLRTEAVGVDPLQRVPPLVVVAVAGGEVEVVGGHAVFLHGGDDLELVLLGDTVDGVKAGTEIGQNGIGKGQHRRGDAQCGVVVVVHG